MPIPCPFARSADIVIEMPRMGKSDCYYSIDYLPMVFTISQRFVVLGALLVCEPVTVLLSIFYTHNHKPQNPLESTQPYIRYGIVTQTLTRDSKLEKLRKSCIGVL